MDWPVIALGYTLQSLMGLQRPQRLVGFWQPKWANISACTSTDFFIWAHITMGATIKLPKKTVSN